MAKVYEGFAHVHRRVAPARPLLIYLRPQDVRSHLRRTLEERDEEWARWLAASFASYGWARSRGLSGEEAVFRFYEEWESVAEELFARHEGPKLWLRDPQEDWVAALAEIHRAVDG